MKRWMITGGVAAILATVLLTTFAISGSEPVRTEDIGAILDLLNHQMDTASFVPDVSKEVVTIKSMEIAGKVLIGLDTSKLVFSQIGNNSPMKLLVGSGRVAR